MCPRNPSRNSVRTCPLNLVRLSSKLECEMHSMDGMKLTLNLDEETLKEADQVAKLVRERPATILRMAIREGLPGIVKRMALPEIAGWAIVKACDCKGGDRPGYPVPQCAVCCKPWKLVFADEKKAAHDPKKDNAA